MPGRERSRTDWRKGLENAAWWMAVGMPFSMIACILAVHLLDLATMPKAVGVTLVPSWQLAWQSLAWDERYPTPPAGSYCDATLSPHRLQIGPVEVRYSSAR